MAKKAIKTQKLTVLLLKDTVKSCKEALRDPTTLTRIPLKPGAAYRGEFWHAKPLSRRPKWQGFIGPILGSKMQKLNTISVSAVLFVRARDRILAFTFAYGRNLLKPDCFELGFGLKSALNRIDHERIRSLDLRTYEDLVVSTRKQTSRNSELGTFGLDISRDLLRAVTGEPKDSSFAKRLTGTDSLTLNVAITVGGLGKKCEQILEAYEDDHYRQNFEWIDHLNEVREQGVRDTLNSKLLKALSAGKTDKLHFAPAEPVDWQRLEKFRITGTRNVEYDDLDVEEYLEALGTKKRDLTHDKLRTHRVSVRWTGTEHFVGAWPLFNCIVWETTSRGRLYALVEGKWFEIEKNFSKRVRTFVKSIPTPSIPLPEANAKENEGHYNERVAAADSRLVCLDRDLVKPEDAASKIEFCDLLSKQGQFIHVKKKTRSATLSHLFAQGTVSAREFLQDGHVREQLRDHLRGKVGASGFVRLIPSKSKRPTAADYEIAFAIISKPHPKWPASLPFFSQLNLMQNGKLLQGLGFRMTLQQIAEG